MTIDVLRGLVLPRLTGVKPSGSDRYMALCPSHDDQAASLSISRGDRQPVVFHCHANCDPETILDALDLSWEELSEPRPVEPVGTGTWTPAGQAVAVYDYRDEAGETLYQVCRTANKEFRQRTPSATEKSGWRWTLGQVRRVPYRLPELLSAVAAGREIWIPEGEKDVLSLVGIGLAATCNSGGAGKWLPEFATHLTDANVVIVADKDDPGRAHARQIRDSLEGVAQTIKIVEAPADHKDVSALLGSGGNISELLTTWTSHPEQTTALALDIWEFLATDDPPYDWIVPDLLEHGDRLILTGFEGLGKSMLIRQLAVAIAAGLDPFRLTQHIKPARVLVIDCENTERQSRRRFRPLAQATIDNKRRIPDGGLRIIHRSGGLDLTNKTDPAWLMEQVTAHQPDVLCIGPFYKLHRANMNDELPARKVAAVLDQIRETTNAALLIEAHAGHNETSQGTRSVRPTGSSLLLRWPEFGYGIRSPQGGDEGTVEVVGWRGPRDERNWPKRLTRGRLINSPWPWIPAPEDTGRNR